MEGRTPPPTLVQCFLRSRPASPHLGRQYSTSKPSAWWKLLIFSASPRCCGMHISVLRPTPVIWHTGEIAGAAQTSCELPHRSQTPSLQACSSARYHDWSRWRLSVSLLTTTDHVRFNTVMKLQAVLQWPMALLSGVFSPPQRRNVQLPLPIHHWHHPIRLASAPLPFCLSKQTASSITSEPHVSLSQEPTMPTGASIQSCHLHIPQANQLGTPGSPA